MNLKSKLLAFSAVLAAVIVLTSSLTPTVRGGPTETTESASTLAASTFFGSGGEVAITAIATASDGTVYAVGYVTAGTLPTVYPAYDRTRNGVDGFVARFSPDLQTLLNSTYLGGGNEDRCTAVALGADGSVYVTGYTSSSDFPTTSGAYDRSWGGSASSDVFVAKLSGNLRTLVASTFLGASASERSSSIAVTAAGVIVAGTTFSASFPTTNGAYDTSYNGQSDGFLSVLSNDLTSLTTSTFVGSTADDTIDALTVVDNTVFFTGSTAGSYPTVYPAYDRTRNGVDAFVSSMPLDLRSMTSSTYLGGGNAEYGLGIAADSSGVYVVGSTASSDFPTTTNAYDRSFNGGGYDGFASKLSLDLKTLTASTFLGGSGYDRSIGLLVSLGNVFVVGESKSTNFPMTADAYDPSSNGASDAVVVQLDANLASLVTSTYLGGAGNDLASTVVIAGHGGILVAGSTYSSAFPATLGSYDTSFNGGTAGSDGFLTWLDIGGTATHRPPVATFSASPVSGSAPLTVQFTDHSTNVPTSWSWSFGDGGSSAAQNPSYTYMNAGTYTVSLTATNSAGSDTMTRTAYITVSAPTVPQQDWAEFQGGPYHDGVTTNDGTITTAAASWSVQVSAAPDGMSGIDVAPIVADGKAFVVDYRGYVYAFRVSDGHQLWANTALGLGTSSFQLSTPAYHDGVLYVALIRGPGQGVDVYALNADDGTTLWSKVQIVKGFFQPNTPVIYDDGHIYFGTWYSDEDEIGRYYCLYANNGTTLWSRSATSGTGYYWAGAAIIGNYLVYGDETGRLVSVNKLSGIAVQETTIYAVFGIPNSEIHSSVSYSEQTHRVYFTAKGGYCFALGFDAGTGHFVTTDKWSRNIGFSTSTPAVYNGKVYVGTGDFSDTNGHTLYCLNEVDGSIAWTFVANGGIQASPVVSLNDNGQVYVYFTTNCADGRAYCVDASGNEKWHFEPESGKVQYTLQGVAVYDGKVLFGNDAAWLFALGGE